MKISRGTFERRLAAVLAADVAGYSRLMGADEEGTLNRLKAIRKELVDLTIARHRGRIVKTTGDGMLVEFASAVDAVRCAVEVQRGMAERSATVPRDQRIEFRIGIHVGDVIVDESDIFGDGVNVAARLEGIAEPGGISLSDDAYRQVRGKVEIACDDTGPQLLKNIAHPMQVWRVRLAGLNVSAMPQGLTSTGHPALPLPERPSIAVLPFQNMSGDPEQEYFADGMVEDIITALSRFKSLFVIARNSSFTYKGKATDIRQVGRELGVHYVLEGSVRRVGGQVRITAQLIEAASNNHLWAEKLDGKLDDIFTLQDSLTMSIVSSVATRVEQAELDRARRKPTTHLDAYDLYLRAMSLWHEGRHDDAYEAFCRAFALDSNFASAYAMAAVSLFSKQTGQGVPLSADAHAEALRLARLAAKLGQEDAYALARAAHVLANLGQHFDLARELANRATALNPNMGVAWLCKGWVSIVMGDGTDALASFATVLRLDPLDPAKARAWAGLACAHFVLGDFETGYQWAQRAAEDSPAVWTLAYVVINAVPTGRMEEARTAVRRIRELRPAFGLREALLVCHTAERLRAQIRSSFIEAGIPE